VETAANLPAILIAMQIAVLGWRINREIPHGDKGLRTWFPVADSLNVISLISIVWFCVVVPRNAPLNSGNRVYEPAKIALSVGFILMAMYPINMIAHYRFASRFGRSVYTEQGRDYPYITDHECITLPITFLIFAGYLASQCPILFK
jgi:hypothetical protein